MSTPHSFRLLTREEIETVPGMISPVPDSLFAVGSVDEQGVVSCIAGFLVLHADPLWIREDHRHEGRLLLRLWEAFRGELVRRGAKRIEVGMTDKNPGHPTESLVERACEFAGGYELKARFFAIPVEA